MWFGRFLLWFFKPLAWLLFPFKTIGRENIPDTPGQPPLVLCCNHISVIDPVFHSLSTFSSHMVNIIRILQVK